MKLKFYPSLLLLLGLLLTAYTSKAQTYCTPSFPGGVSAITKVQWGTMSNTSSGASLLGYENFNANADTVTGGNLELLIEGITAGYTTDSIYAFFDWKSNGTFTDSLDSVFIGNNTNTGSAPLQFQYRVVINPPVDSLPSTPFYLNVRFMKKQGTVYSPCNSSGVGQAEDYSIYYLPGTQCSGTPFAGFLTVKSPAPCAMVPIFITDSAYTIGYGMDWQWFMSYSPIAFSQFPTWTPVFGATTPTLYIPDTCLNCVFSLVASCINGGGFDWTTPVEVNPLWGYVNTNAPYCTGQNVYAGAVLCSVCTMAITGPNGFTASYAYSNPPSQAFTIPNVSMANNGWYHYTVTNVQCNTSYLDSFYLNVSNCADSVWPGDANDDLIVDNADILQLGLAMGNTGYSRPAHDTAYYAQFCYDWITSFNGVNCKHADCDGNSVVSLNDTMAIHSHYGIPHPKTTPAPHAKVSSFPDLYFDIANAPIVTGQNTIPLMLGSATLPMNNFYGIAAKIKISGLTLNTQATVTPVSSWINFPLTFQRNVGNEQDDIALCKTDHQNSSGYGQLCLLHFNLPSGHSGDSIKLQLDDVRLVDAAGNVLTDYNIIDLSAMIDDPTSVRSLSTLSYAAVIPNPSGPEATLQINTNEPASVQLTLADATGKQLWRNILPKAQGLQNVNLPGHLAPGMYFIRLDVDGARGQTLKWVKQQ